MLARVGPLLVLVLCACSPGKDEAGAPLGGKDVGTDGSLDVAIDEDTGPGDGGFVVDAPLPTETGPGKGCGTAADPDLDCDGYPASIDCNDKDATINPEAYDFEGDSVDNDCDGTPDNPVKTCAVSTTSDDAKDFGRAADLCPQRSKTKAGTVYDPLAKAEFGAAGGSVTKPSQRKIVNAFGDNKPRMGDTFFGIQNGPWGSTDPRAAKALDIFPALGGCGAIPLNADDCKQLSNGASPLPGFPVNIQDWAEVRLFIVVPTNAKAMSFDFAFVSTEFSQYWNSSFNDAFFALVTSKKIAGANVAKDAKGRAITVNSGFFQLCPKPGTVTGVDPKALASAPCVGTTGDATVAGTLKGTNFDGAGAGSTDDTIAGTGSTKYVYGGGTGWLSAKFEVEPGEKIVVRFTVNDTSDGILDSAAIVDNIRWDKAPPKVPTGEVERPPK